jgi:hypothetical protein
MHDRADISCSFVVANPAHRAGTNDTQETALCFARIKSAFEMNKLQRGDVTCDMPSGPAKLQFARDSVVHKSQSGFYTYLAS